MMSEGLSNNPTQPLVSSASGGHDVAGSCKYADCVRVHVAGEELYLSPLRAVYWPREHYIIIADAHLGKAQSFRALGCPIPARQILLDQLECMTTLMQQFECKRVLVLGDLLHAPIGLTPELLSDVSNWVAASGVQMHLVPGNHDRQLSRVSSLWNLTLLPDVYVIEPFTFVHEPRSVAGTHVWCGHIHPSVRLRNGHDAMKLPAFHIGTKLSVLPAFSRFTAGGPIAPISGDRVFAVAQDRVIPLM
jgi:DNA ligase-associated metallophosphoesterase